MMRGARGPQGGAKVHREGAGTAPNAERTYNAERGLTQICGEGGGPSLERESELRSRVPFVLCDSHPPNPGMLIAVRDVNNPF